MKTLRILFATGVATAMLAACGDAPDQPAEPMEPAPRTQPTEPAAPQTQPAEPEATTPAANGEFELAGNAAEGQASYVLHCSSCHGTEGRGDGPAGRMLQPPPTDFAAADVPAERAYRAVREGGPAVGLAATMPAFDRMLDDQEIRDVVAYALSLGDDG